MRALVILTAERGRFHETAPVERAFRDDDGQKPAADGRRGERLFWRVLSGLNAALPKEKPLSFTEGKNSAGRPCPSHLSGSRRIRRPFRRAVSLLLSPSTGRTERSGCRGIGLAGGLELVVPSEYAADVIESVAFRELDPLVKLQFQRLLTVKVVGQ